MVDEYSVSSVIEDVAYLLGALNDGGCYSYRYSGGRTEYRCVWTQGDSAYLEKSVLPRVEKLIEVFKLGCKPIIRRVGPRFELRVSCKALYTLLKRFEGDLQGYVVKDLAFALMFIRGLYDAEGDKSSGRVRIWNKNVKLLEIVADAVQNMLGIDVYGPYIDDKRHGVYVLEIPSNLRKKFLHIISPEHPKLNNPRA